MIEQGETGDDGYDVMIIGKAIKIRDESGGRGGTTIAKLAVAATPAGSAPLLTRVYFYRPPPSVAVSENFEFHRGRWYVVIAAHRKGGGFDFDGACGQTRSVKPGAVPSPRAARRTRLTGLPYRAPPARVDPLALRRLSC